MPAAKSEKLDLLKHHKAEYAQPKKPALVEMKPAQYLAVVGRGAPGGEVFQQRIGALYAIAYTMKFLSKDAGRDYTVCKLETIYGIDGQTADVFETLPPEQWKWKLLIRVPDFIKAADLKKTQKVLREKQKEGAFDLVKLEKIDEGRCVQMLHVGPYEEEHRAVEAMRAFAEEQGLTPHKWQHDVYLNDPRRIPPERLKTIVRLPVKG